MSWPHRKYFIFYVPKLLKYFVILEIILMALVILHWILIWLFQIS